MLSGIITSILLVSFVAGWIWVWSPSQKSRFEELARVPLEDARREKGNSP